MATEMRGRRRREDGGAALEKRQGRTGGVGGEERTEEDVESRSRGGEVTRGISPDVSRPERYPHENPAPTGARSASGGLPNGPVSRAVENRRAGFSPREKAGIPGGSRAAKVGLIESNPGRSASSEPTTDRYNSTNSRRPAVMAAR